jgi:hypothetical protein
VTIASLWGTNNAGGYTVAVDHGGGVSSYYLHLSQFAVSVGAVVTQGQIVGYSGGVLGEPGSGSSTGAHIHWHINNNGSVIDPAVYAAAHPTNPPTGGEEDDMIRLTHCPNAAGSGADEYIVIDHGQHSYWSVPNTEMLGLLRAQGINEIKDRQGRQIIAGYKKIS